jgi:HNH endonuclease
MLRRAENVRVAFQMRYFWRPTLVLAVGNRTYSIRMSKERFDELQNQQDQFPISYPIPSSHRTYWQFREKFYWEIEGLTQDEVHALLLERERKQERAIVRARVFSSRDEEVASTARIAIPDPVKSFVWQRDQGRCVKCGTNELLEFDHIIPLAMGGSNSSRNLQLLCQTCNRAKGGHLG